MNNMQTRKTVLFFFILVFLFTSCQSNNKNANHQDKTALEPPWQPVEGNEFNLIVTGMVYLNNKLLTSDKSFWVITYGPGGIENDCRSKGIVGNRDWNLQPGQYYATIRGDKKDETINFKLWDSRSGTSYDARENLSFEPEGTRTGFDLHFQE